MFNNGEGLMIARLLTTIFLLFLIAAPSRISNAENKNVQDESFVSVSAPVESEVDGGQLLLSYIKERCRAHKVPVRLVHNVIRIESRWRHADKSQIVGDALLQSSEDAYGLMQVRLPTAQDILDTDTLTSRQLMTDNFVNVEAGIAYLAWLRSYYHGNWYFALAAYNRGILYVNRDIRNGYIPLNEYVYTASVGVFFGKKTTERMDAELSTLREKVNFQDGVIARVTQRAPVLTSSNTPMVIKAVN